MATERGDVDTLVSISHKGIDVTAAHGVVSICYIQIIFCTVIIRDN